MLEVLRLGQKTLSERDAAVQCAADLVRDLGLRPPIQVKALASAMGARIEPVAMEQPAMLVKVGSKHLIKVRAADSWKRQRFSACHEIAHLFMSNYEVTFTGCDPRESGNVAPLPFSNVGVERLCDEAASELLLPSTLLRADTGAALVPWDEIESLSDGYQASLTATAIKIAAVAVPRVRMLCLEFATKPSQPSAPPKFRVQWDTPDRDWPRAWPHKSLPEDHPILRALQGDCWSGICSLSALCTDRPDGRTWRVHAKHLEYGGADRILVHAAPARARTL